MTDESHNLPEEERDDDDDIRRALEADAALGASRNGACGDDNRHDNHHDRVHDHGILEHILQKC